MFIYDVLNKEKVYQIVSNDLRNLGVKRRVKKQSTTTTTTTTTTAKHNNVQSSCSSPPPSSLSNNKNISNTNPNLQSLKKVFKTPLTHLPLDVVKLSSGGIIHVPNFLTQACSQIEKSITQEGIFRKAGSHLRQKEIISRLDNGGTLGDKYQVIDVANVLKTFFRELPEPLIPICYHDVFLRCALLKNYSSKIEAILLACILLPPHHLNALAFFAEFLKRVAKHEKLNKMGADNLAKVIAPNLMPIQETTMSAIQARLETQMTIVKILIENAERIGTLPDNVANFVTSESLASVETELDASDAAISKNNKNNKKKKRRSGSLTRKTHLSASNLNLRMLNGLKKMVSKSGSPDDVDSVRTSRVLSTDFNPAHTPSIKTGKKRKVIESGAAAPLSAKKKREVLQNMPDVGSNRQGNVLPSIVSSDPNPCKEKSPAHKSRVKKYLSQKVHNDISSAGVEKQEKTKKIRLSLDRLVSRSKQKLSDLETNNHAKKSNNSPKIERRWSSVSGSSWSKKKRVVYETESIGTGESSITRTKNNKKILEDVYDLEVEEGEEETTDEIFMDAEVNLSDENNTFDDKIMEICNKEDEEYVTIPKSEYEEIKNRVYAIESRISQEFSSISNNVAQNLASKVQSEYEKTLEEASIGNTTTADHLAKRLGKELKIRRSSEHKIIRSPSARKIGNLRRRSQEKPIGKRSTGSSSRHVSWLVGSKQMNMNDDTQNQRQQDLNNLNIKSNLKRGRPNTIYTGLTQRMNSNSSSNSELNINDTKICSDETNARLDFLQKQLHALITHTVEHTKGSLSSSLSDDEDGIFNISDKEEDEKRILIENEDNVLRSGRIRRASSFHGSEFGNNGSKSLNRKIKELKKSNSQQDVGLNDFGMTMNTGGGGDRMKNLNWKDADCYFSVDYNNRTPAQQTGRASVAKLRTQNAGMVLAKAKLFDDCNLERRGEGKSTDGNSKRQSSDVRQERIRENGKNLDLDSSKRSIAGSQRRKHSKSPKNNNSSSAKLKLIRSRSSNEDSSAPPLIKMELTIMPPSSSSLSSKKNSSISERRRSGSEGRFDVNSDRESELECFNDENNRMGDKKKNRLVDDDCDKRHRRYSIVKESSNKNVIDISNSNMNFNLNSNSNFNTPCKISTPHIKRPLTLKTPKEAKNLIRKHGIDSKRTPMKAVALNSAQLNTPRRQSPRSVIKSRQLTRNVS